MSARFIFDSLSEFQFGEIVIRDGEAFKRQVGLIGDYLAGVILEALNGQLVATVLDQLNNGVVEGILVLLQPSSQVVGDGGGVVDDGKVRIRVGAGVGLGKLGPLAQKVGHELLGEGGIGRFWEEGLLLKDGEEGHGLLKHVNALLQIHAEVNVGPVQALANVHFLQHQGYYFGENNN